MLVIPGDVLHRHATPSTAITAPVTPGGRVMPPPEQVTELARRLNAAETVTLFCGAGVQGAHAEVMALAGRLNSPVGHSLRGKEWVQYDNPFDVGMSGLLGYGACYDATRQADLLLLLGTDFPYSDFLPGAHTVQVEHDLARIGRRTPLELGVHGDVGATLTAVLDLVEQKTDRAFWTACCTGTRTRSITSSTPTPTTSRTTCQSIPSTRRRSSTTSPTTTTRYSPSTPERATYGGPIRDPRTDAGK